MKIVVRFLPSISLIRTDDIKTPTQRLPPVLP